MILWIVRILVGLVLVMNVDCAVSFLVAPGNFAPGFELQGAVGDAVIQGFGILFLMWNIPYAFALWHPQKNYLSLVQAVMMQAVGLVGESGIYASLPAAHMIMKGSIQRFIIFDGAGLIALLLAWIIVFLDKKREKEI